MTDFFTRAPFLGFRVVVNDYDDKQTLQRTFVEVKGFRAGVCMFRERLLEAIGKSRKTDAQIAADAGISPQALNNYKEGRLPKMEQAMALAASLDTSVGWLLGEVGSGAGPERQVSNDPVVSVEIERSLAILGWPNADQLSKMIDVPPRQIRGWLEEKRQPSHAQLARLFNRIAVASEAMALVVRGHVDASQAKPASPRKRRAA